MGIEPFLLQVKACLDEILEKLPDSFNMIEIIAKAEEKTPFIIVVFQECERMNNLTMEMSRSLRELNLGLKVCMLHLLALLWKHTPPFSVKLKC